MFLEFLKLLVFVYSMIVFMPIMVLRHMPDFMFRHLGWAFPKALLATIILFFGEGHYAYALFIGGLASGAVVALRGFERGIQLAAAEFLLLVCLAFGMAYFHGDTRGILGLDWFLRQVGRAQSEFTSFGVAIQQSDLGMFTLGCLVGTVASLPARMFLKLRAANVIEAEADLRRSGRIPKREQAKRRGLKLARKDKRSNFRKRIDKVSGYEPMFVTAE